MKKALLSLTTLLLGCHIPNYDTTPAKVELAQCLVREGTMYGTYWCWPCNQQKTEFGPEAWKILKGKYVECSEEGTQKEQQQCEREGIHIFPTWKFRNGETFKGYRSDFLYRLAEASGCD